MPYKFNPLTGELDYYEVGAAAASGLTLSPQDDDYTAADGELVLADLSTKSIVVTLPAVADDARIGIKLGTASGTRTVTITPDGTDEIDGQTSIILYVENDYIELQGNATDGQWIVVEDGVQPHIAKMTNSTTQTLTTSGVTYTAQYNTVERDNAGLASTASDNFTIRRTGYYSIAAYARISSALDAAQRFVLNIALNGTQLAENLAYSPGTNLTVAPTTTWSGNLSSGDVITVTYTQDGGTTHTVAGSASVYPYASVTEIRGVGHGAGARHPHYEFTSQTSEYNAVDGDYVLADATSASFDVNLPAAPLQNTRIAVKLTGTASSRTVTLVPDGTDEIDSQTSIVLYVVNDFIEVMWDGSMWRIIGDGVQPHMASMSRDTAATMTNGVATKVPLATVLFDNAGLADAVTNNRFTVRRGGNYIVTCQSRSSGVIDDAEVWNNFIYVNGNIRKAVATFSAATNSAAGGNNTAILALSAGDYVEMFITQNEGADQSTDTAVQNRPEMSVAEMRGGGHGSGGAIPLSQVVAHTGNGRGSVNTSVRRWTTSVSTGTAITYADSSTAGGSFTIIEDGLYSVSFADVDTTSAVQFVVSKNDTAAPASTTTTNRLTPIALQNTAGSTANSAGVFRLVAGDIVRLNCTASATLLGSNDRVSFQITKIAN